MPIVAVLREGYHAIRRSSALALLQIERLAGIEDGDAKLGPVAPVDGHDLSAHRLRMPAGAHEKRRALVDAHPEQARVREHEREEPVLALAADEVLVEDHAGQEPEPGPHPHLAGVDDGEVSLAGDRERRDDGRAGAGARDGGAVTVARPQRRRHDVVRERIEQPLLVSSRQEDPGGALQAAPEVGASVLAEGRGGGRLHGAGREGTERIAHGLEAVAGVDRSPRQDEDVRAASARPLHEAREGRLGRAAAAEKHEARLGPGHWSCCQSHDNGGRHTRAHDAKSSVTASLTLSRSLA